MIRLYDENNKFLAFIENVKSIKIESELSTGLQSLTLKIPTTEEYVSLLQEEQYIETKDYRYVIKEILLDRHSLFEVHCVADIEELKYSIIQVCDIFDRNIEAALLKILEYVDSSWTIEYNSTLLNIVQYQIAHVSAYEMLEKIKEDYSLEYFYDTKKKILKIYNRRGKEKGSYFSNELNLHLLKRQGQSYNLCTVLYPVGKDNLNIGSVNNGITFVENYQYSNKYLPKFLIRDDITEAQDLKSAAEQYLNYYSQPIVGYELRLSQLPEQVEVGDTITIVDKIKHIKQKQRVVKITRFPHQPERDKVELSNRIINLPSLIKHYNSEYENKIEYIKQNLTELQ